MSEKDWFVIAAVLLVLFSLGSFGMTGFGGMMGLGTAIFWPFHFLLGLAFLAALLWIFFRGASVVRPPEDAKSVLKHRLASGEISIEEFKALSKVIQ